MNPIDPIFSSGEPSHSTPTKDGQTVTSFHDLVAWLEAGCKPRESRKIGLELETFAFTRSDLRPLPYFGEIGIRSLLLHLAEAHGWRIELENDNPIMLHMPSGGAVTLEPANQIELSSPPAATLDELKKCLFDWQQQLRQAADTFDLGFLGTGFAPQWQLSDLAHVPKKRYDIMRRYMTQVGTRGHDMMHRTATAQVAIDYESESDMVRKMRVALGLQPIVAAMVANSPFEDNQPTGHRSGRHLVWHDTDPHRTGQLEFFFEQGMDFERYARYAIAVPMYFLYGTHGYEDVAGLDFRQFMRGELPGHKGRFPTFNDWSWHLTTIFPEARLKHYIEMRGADSNDAQTVFALATLWWGLCYDSDALNGAHDLVTSWTAEERSSMYHEAPHAGLATPVRRYSVGDVGLEVLHMAELGLRNSGAEAQVEALEPLRRTIEDRKSPADRLLESYYGPWQRDLSPIYDVCDFSRHSSFSS